MAFIQKHLFSVSRPHQRGWIGGNQESICHSPQKPPSKPCLAERQSAKRVKQLFSDTFSWIFHGQVVLVASSPAYVRVLQCFHTFFLSPSVCHPNRTLRSKRSLIGQNRLFGSCGSASPQNVPPLCHSKDWEDAAGCGHKEEGRGWHRREKKKKKITTSKTRGSYMEHSQMGENGG